MWTCRAAVTVPLLLAALASAAAVEQLRVVYEWYKVDLAWTGDQHKLDAYTRKRYEPRNNVIENVRVWGDTVFLTLPRSKPGVPATLVTVPSTPSGPSASPRLHPYPDWASQELGVCDRLQNVRALEVDPAGRVWVADSGVVGEFREYSEPDNKCPPKLVVYDVMTRDLVSQYEFSRELLPPNSVLSDIVLDPRGDTTAYISVVADSQAFLVVYHNRTRSAEKVTLADLPRLEMTSVVVNGSEVPLRLNKLSLALSLRRNTLYLAPSWKETLYSLDLPTEDSARVHRVADLPGLSYSLTVDSQDTLYFSHLEGDAVGKWNTSQRFDPGAIVARDHNFLQFPSSFSLDKHDTFWVVSNRMQTYFSGDVNLEVPNFRLLRSYTGTRSYMYATVNSAGSHVYLHTFSLLIGLLSANIVLR